MAVSLRRRKNREIFYLCLNTLFFFDPNIAIFFFLFYTSILFITFSCHSSSYAPASYPEPSFRFSISSCLFLFYSCFFFNSLGQRTTHQTPEGLILL
jgi:hypothetical protein